MSSIAVPKLPQSDPEPIAEETKHSLSGMGASNGGPVPSGAWFPTGQVGALVGA